MYYQYSCFNPALILGSLFADLLGTYSDFDVVWLNSVPGYVQNIGVTVSGLVGRDFLGSNGKCDWCLTYTRRTPGVQQSKINILDYVPIEGEYPSYIGTAVIVNVDQGNPLMREAFRRGFDGNFYDPLCWSCAGPIAITTAFKDLEFSR